jgi:hypothetical protein
MDDKSMAFPYAASRDALYFPESCEDLLLQYPHTGILSLAAEASRLAYLRSETDSKERHRLTENLENAGFQPPQILAKTALGAYAYAAFRTRDRLALISFRGTHVDDAKDLCTNINFKLEAWITQGKVHSGFKASALALQEEVLSWLANTSYESLVLTGHSLGGSIATLMSSLTGPCKLITIGCPRVGNDTFASSLDHVQQVRLVNCCDVVTRVPTPELGYSHSSVATYITRNGSLKENPDHGGVLIDQNLARLLYLPVSVVPNNVKLRDLADHAPSNYIRALFK